jgi:hypothetical protein
MSNMTYTHPKYNLELILGHPSQQEVTSKLEHILDIFKVMYLHVNEL